MTVFQRGQMVWECKRDWQDSVMRCDTWGVDHFDKDDKVLEIRCDIASLPEEFDKEV